MLKQKIINLALLVVLIGLFPFKANAAGELKEFEVKNLGSNNEYCNDQDTCPGMCSCELEASYLVSGTLSLGVMDTKNYKWTVFNPHQDHLLYVGGDKDGSHKYSYDAFLTFDSSECSITINVSDPSLKDSPKTAVGKCNYQPPFCCCVPDPKTGTLSDCQRLVNHTDPNSKAPYFSPSCAQIADGKHKPYVTLDDGKTLNYGQCGTFQDQHNQIITAKQNAQAQAQQGNDVKYESRKLNELTFSTPQELVGKIIQLFLGFIGSIAFALYIIAGLLWMTARGESEKIEQAKRIMFWVTAGVAVMLASYVIVSNLFKLVTP